MHDWGESERRGGTEDRGMDLARLARMSLEELLYYVLLELRAKEPGAVVA